MTDKTLLDAARQAAAAAGAEIYTRLDGVFSSLSGTGTDADKAASLRWLYPNEVSTDLARAIYRGSAYAQRLIEDLPRDAMRDGWSIVTPDDAALDAQALDAWEEELCFEHVFEQLIFQGRYFGNAWLWMVVDDGRPLREPLDLEQTFTLSGLVLLSPDDIAPYRYSALPGSTRYGYPETYRIAAAGEYGEIHHSRLIEWWGLYLDRESFQENGGYHQSLFVSTQDAIKQQEETDAQLSTHIGEARLDIITLGKQSISPRDRSGSSPVSLHQSAQRVVNKVRTLARYKSVVGMAVLDEGDNFERVSSNLTGLDKLIDKRRETTAATLNMSMVELFGIPPSGLTSDDQSSARGRRLRGKVMQRNIRRALRQFYGVSFAAQNGPTGGVRPERFTISLGSMDEPELESEANAARTMAETDQKYVDMGVPGEVFALARLNGGRPSTDMPALPEDVRDRLEETVQAWVRGEQDDTPQQDDPPGQGEQQEMTPPEQQDEPPEQQGEGDPEV